MLVSALMMHAGYGPVWHSIRNDLVFASVAVSAASAAVANSADVNSEDC